MKYTERELMERDIFKVESGWYLLGDTEVNTNEEYYEDGHGIENIDLSNFQVSDNDLVIIHTWGEPTNKWNLLIINCDKPCGTEGFAYNSCLGKYGELYDDSRYYVTHYIAEQIRQMGVKNVTVKFYLWRTEKEIEDYMEWVESMDI